MGFLGGRPYPALIGRSIGRRTTRQLRDHSGRLQAVMHSRALRALAASQPKSPAIRCPLREHSQPTKWTLPDTFRRSLGHIRRMLPRLTSGIYSGNDSFLSSFSFYRLLLTWIELI